MAGKNTEEVERLEAAVRFREVIKKDGTRRLQQCFRVMKGKNLLRHDWRYVPIVKEEDLQSGKV